MADKPKLTKEQHYEVMRGAWWDYVSMDEAKAEHGETVKKIIANVKWREDKNRALSVLLIHGSQRHPEQSCAHEESNSKMLLKKGLELAMKEYEGEVEVHELVLREMVMNPCNGCYSTTSALCHFPCSCFPVNDDISTEAYAAFARADVYLFSTPVNEGAYSGRLKILIDRLISMDGGYTLLPDQLEPKTSEYRERMIRASVEDAVYDQRMFGRVCGYIVSSKDHANSLDDYSPVDDAVKKQYFYDDIVIGSLYTSFHERGCYHADPFYLLAGSNPHEEMAYDKDFYSKNESYHQGAKRVVLASMELADKIRRNPPEFIGGSRQNRT